MNILPINNSSFAKSGLFLQKTNQFCNQDSNGLIMASPLLNDTVSFGCTKQTLKKMGSRKDTISAALAKKIRAQKEPSHKRKKQLLFDSLKNLISQECISFYNRIKGENSIREKSATRGWQTLEQVLDHMDDISGFCVILNTSKSFNETIKQLRQLLKTRIIRITEAEYHRREPKYKNSRVIASYDSLKPIELQNLKNDINRIQNPTTQIWKDVDSRSGYSGLHLILQTKDGEKSELQIMTLNMERVKRVENILYKIRNGKTIDKTYEVVEKFLEPLRPLSEFADEKEQAAHKNLQFAMTKYIQEAYTKTLSRPYDKNFKLLHVSEAETLTKKEQKLISKYDLNDIAILMNACEKIASGRS